MSVMEVVKRCNIMLQRYYFSLITAFVLLNLLSLLFLEAVVLFDVCHIFVVTDVPASHCFEVRGFELASIMTLHVP